MADARAGRRRHRQDWAQQAAIEIALARQAEIEVSSASPFEAECLCIKAGSPTILASYRDLGCSAGSDLAPLEFARMVFRADITAFG